MKYCKLCKVNVNKKHTNCPLCGSYLEEKDKPKPFEQYASFENNVVFPQIDVKERVDFLKTKASLMTLFAAAVCVVMNILLNRESLWSIYVVIGSFFLLVCIIRPIVYHSKVFVQIFIDLPIVTILTLAMELTINRLTGLQISIKYVLPAMYLASIVLTDFLIIFTTKTVTGNFSLLLLCTLFAITPQLLTWIFLYKFGYESLVSFITFFFALTNFFIVYLVCNKRIKEEYNRKWNL